MRCEVDIKKLIPQRDPIMMVDQLMDMDGDKAETSLVVTSDNYFMEADGMLAEVGLIEHIAQSASAFAGYKALLDGATEPPLGYIGEVKNFHCHRRPLVGETLRTTITMGAEVAGITILTGETRVNDELIADTSMKIFIKNEA